MTDPHPNSATPTNPNGAIAGPAVEAGGPAAAANPMMPHVLEGLGRLTDAELRRLDAAITPDAAFLLTKAFGPEMGTLLWPLVANDKTGVAVGGKQEAAEADR